MNKVKSWKNSKERYRWIAAALLEIEIKMRKVNKFNNLEKIQKTNTNEIQNGSPNSNQQLYQQNQNMPQQYASQGGMVHGMNIRQVPIQNIGAHASSSVQSQHFSPKKEKPHTVDSSERLGGQLQETIGCQDLPFSRFTNMDQSCGRADIGSKAGDLHSG